MTIREYRKYNRVERIDLTEIKNKPKLRKIKQRIREYKSNKVAKYNYQYLTSTEGEHFKISKENKGSFEFSTIHHNAQGNKDVSLIHFDICK
jgi:hypothetical protein